MVEQSGDPIDSLSLDRHVRETETNEGNDGGCESGEADRESGRPLAIVDSEVGPAIEERDRSRHLERDH